MFLRKEELVKYERDCDWSGALKYLEQLWQSNKHNAELALRLITEYWFVLSNIECIRCPDSIDEQELKACMISAVDESDSAGLREIPVYLCVTGYIMIMTPHLFVSAKRAYDDVITEGKKRLAGAAAKAPHDIFIQMINQGFIQSYDRFKEYQRRNRNAVNELPWDETQVSRYFQSILCSVC